jgi:hypothetical protein
MSRTPFAYPHPRRRRVVLFLATLGTIGIVLAGASPAAPDDGRPPKPRGLRVAAFTSTSVKLAWDRTTRRYRLIRGHTLVDTTARTRYTFSNLKCGRVYRLGVQAVDRDGDVSSVSVRLAHTRSCRPLSTSNPQVSGVAQEGQTLATTAGTWSGQTPMTYTYRWLRCDPGGSACSAIAGAFEATYAASSEDVGSTLRSQVEAGNVYGYSSATSSATTLVASAPADPPLAGDPSTGGDSDPPASVELVDRTFNCTGPVDLDLVRVTMRTTVDDAIHLRPGCTGRIGRVEIETWTADGIKVNAPSAPVPQDIVVGGGYILCHDRYGDIHQDGVQAMGGERILFQNLTVHCVSAGNAQFFVSAAVGGTPKDVVCDHCFLGPGGATTLRVENSYRSGARNTLLCKARYFWSAFEDGAVDPVDADNTNLATTDPRCS